VYEINGKISFSRRLFLGGHLRLVLYSGKYNTSNLKLWHSRCVR